MTHLTSDQLIDALEGVSPADRQAHLAECDECRRQLSELASVFSEAAAVSTPDPSPLFWAHFSSRVNDAIDAESFGGWPQWLRWQVLLPLGATALVILSLMLSLSRQTRIDVADETPVAVIESPDADHWGAFAELVGELDIETASAAGVIAPGTAEQAVLQLTTEERQELTRLLQAEMTRAKS